MYESDITTFLRELRARHPDLEKSQKEGRARLWDRPQDPELTRQAEQARVAQKPYVYQTDA
jgi:hypothetical protein